jgi:hypothetical protein
MISEDSMILSHNGLLLSDLVAVQDLDTIMVAETELGGGAKHKKKVYTTKKKAHHKHLRVKLHTLSVNILISVLLR